jgi:hypothetical protein
MLLLGMKINGAGSKVADMTSHTPAAGQALIDDVLQDTRRSFKGYARNERSCNL